MAMHYDIVFRVGNDHSGRATFLGKIYGGYTSPYQKAIGKTRCEQEFIFTDLKGLLNFIKYACEEFEEDFEVMHIEIRKNKLKKSP
jgi:hypothetical protein